MQQEESRFVGHGPCPECGSRDNLGTWSDGHQWCFGCGHFVPPNKLEFVRNHFLPKNKNKENGNIIYLPDDFNSSIPSIGIAWLKKYSLTDGEIRKWGLGWSHDGVFVTNKQIILNPLLIIPIRDEIGNLFFWQGRYFGHNPEKPKYFSRGNKSATLVEMGHVESKEIVLVEDFISALRVARHTKVSPLFGATLSDDNLLRIQSKFTQVTVWLDEDKRQESVAIVRKLSPYFRSVSTIFSTRDPKDYSDTEIASFLKYKGKTNV